MTNNYNMQENNMVPAILNWHGRDGLQFLLTSNESEKCIRPALGL